MIRQLTMVAIGLAATVSAQTKFDNGMVVMVKGGGAVNIHTESTRSNSPLSTSGVVSIGEGDVSHRVVMGPQGKVLFAYDITLLPVPNNSRAYTIRVKPADPDHFMQQYVTFAPGDVLRIAVRQRGEFNGTHIIRPDGNISLPRIGEVMAGGLSPSGLAAELKKRLTGHLAEPAVSVRVIAARREYPTIAAAREFPAVRLGEAVQLDILHNPTTDETIFDVIQPVEPPASMSRRVAPEDEISLEQARISMNGATLMERRNSWSIGLVVKLTLPRRGTVYLAVKPSTSYPFQALGRVDGGKLTFPLGNDMVEIVSRSNILKTAETGTVWIYHDTTSKPSQNVDVQVGFPEDLLPKR